MPMALQAEGKDMIVAVISLAHVGALPSIGNVTSRAMPSMDRCLLRGPCLAVHDAQVLAHAVIVFVVVMLDKLFDLIVDAAVVSSL